MQTNCMGEMQSAWKGGDSQSEGVMKCLNAFFTGKSQGACLAEESDSKTAANILGCGRCNDCYDGKKPKDCSIYSNSNWNFNNPAGGSGDYSKYSDYSKYT